MKTLSKIFLNIILASISFISCQIQTEEPTPIVTNNTTIFTKYISIGGSLVAGYTNGGLYRDGQLTSFPNLIAQQAGVTFDQALFSIEQENGTGYLTTSINNSTIIFDKIINKSAIITTNPLTLTKYSGSLNNYGVVGLRMSDMGKVGLGNTKIQDFNPYFERIIPVGKEDYTYSDFIKESNPTFFLASIGENDLLAFATSGGQTPMTATSGFSLNCQKLLTALVANNAQGIITNVVNITDLPYFNFYSFAELAKNSGVSDIYITTGNGIVRAATANDKILLDAIPNVGKNKKGFSATFPLSPQEVLDKDEINVIASLLSDYNGVLKYEAEKRNITFFDLKGLYTQIKNQTYSANGIQFDNSLMKGGFFSLDGLNPTPRGSAVIANEMIKVINEKYKNSLKTAIPTLDVSKFEGLKIK